ncbi:MAG TPA: multiheme c-type cytochrome [Anaerolineales bacterium]|nr:multiheme c-type cytochrome [Anaerolineales bacterium]
MKKTIALIIFLSIFILLVLSSCQMNPEEEVLPTASPTPTLPPAQEEIYMQWEGSQHADTYDLGKGPNTYCAKCHSPMNWDHSATIDPAPNCVSCKFPFEDEPRIAEGNPLVEEEHWNNIGCEVCHRMNGRVADSEFAWYDKSTGYYEVMQTSTELCEKCHQNSEEFLMHKREMGEEVHVGFTCTECHDPHDPYVTCGSSSCHSDIAQLRTLSTENHIGITDKSQCLACHPAGMDTHSMELQRTGEKDCLVCHDYFANLGEDDLAPVYHSGVHVDVACEICHDGSSMEIGLMEESEKWVTLREVVLPFREYSKEYKSHNLSLSVDCARCHYKDNEWGLPEDVTELAN